eukprot:1151693-Pelagomonas_calceolata.AAC.6
MYKGRLELHGAAKVCPLSVGCSVSFYWVMELNCGARSLCISLFFRLSRADNIVRDSELAPIAGEPDGITFAQQSTAFGTTLSPKDQRLFKKGCTCDDSMQYLLRSAQMSLPCPPLTPAQLALYADIGM